MGYMMHAIEPVRHECWVLLFGVVLRTYGGAIAISPKAAIRSTKSGAMGWGHMAL